MSHDQSLNMILQFNLQNKTKMSLSNDFRLAISKSAVRLPIKLDYTQTHKITYIVCNVCTDIKNPNQCHICQIFFRGIIVD